MGDFSSIQDIPDMYSYCKTTGESDLTIFGFVAGHLLNLDGMSDKRDHHDTQKSHTSPPKHHQHVKFIGLLTLSYPTGLKPECEVKRVDIFASDYYLSDYVADIFHPPTV
jgi:hypothetical protein